MSEFSEVISQFITSKNIKMYDLIDYCKIDRSTLYQIIKGKRNPPSNAVLRQMADFMQLTVSEREDLQKAADITRVGEKVYYRRQSVENFLCTFPTDISEIWYRRMNPSGKTDVLFPQSACTALSTNVDVNHFIQNMLIYEMQKEHGHIALILQPDNTLLFQTLTGFLPEKPVLVEQLVCMSSVEEQDAAHSLLHIKNLEMTFPLYVRKNIDYHSYYYYDKVESHFRNMNGYSCMVLTSEHAMLCTSDYRQGIFFEEPEVVKDMWSMYQGYKNKCSELFRFLDIALEDKEQISRMVSMVDYSRPYYILEREPCLEPLLSKDILEKYLDPSIPDKDQYTMLLDGYISELQNTLNEGRFKVYFTRPGLENFIKEGFTIALPNGLLIPLEKEDKVKILGRLKACCHQGSYRMLGQRLEKISPNLHLGINGGMVYLTFTAPDQHVKYLLLTEPQILYMFKDYVENLDEESLCSVEETEQYIDHS